MKSQSDDARASDARCTTRTLMKRASPGNVRAAPGLAAASFEGTLDQPFCVLLFPTVASVHTTHMKPNAALILELESRRVRTFGPPRTIFANRSRPQSPPADTAAKGGRPGLASRAASSRGVHGASVALLPEGTLRSRGATGRVAGSTILGPVRPSDVQPRGTPLARPQHLGEMTR